MKNRSRYQSFPILLCYTFFQICFGVLCHSHRERPPLFVGIFIKTCSLAVLLQENCFCSINLTFQSKFRSVYYKWNDVTLLDKLFDFLELYSKNNPSQPSSYGLYPVDQNMCEFGIIWANRLLKNIKINLICQ